MGRKCKVTLSIVLVIVVLILSFGIICTILQENKVDYYSNILVSALKDKDKITVRDVFLFEFERAYIFEDCYISGEGFVERYNLDISIEQVRPGASENIQRIVFVDDEGLFVNEFKCDSREIVILEKGKVIYPNTVIEKKGSKEKKPLEISFKSTDYYNTGRQ